MRNKPDKDVVVEIDRAGRLGTNQVAMKAGLGKDQQLRIDVDIEMREQTRQECQLLIPIVELCLHPGGSVPPGPLQDRRHLAAAAGQSLLAGDVHGSRQ